MEEEDDTTPEEEDEGAEDVEGEAVAVPPVDAEQAAIQEAGEAAKNNDEILAKG